MKLLKDIVFRPESGTSGLCDLYLPDRVSEADFAVLTIHGGGWNSMTKENFEGVARWLCEDLGMPVCNANYRLSCEAPWPACGDDCLTAAKFLLADTRIPGDPARRKLFVVGGSSGGHLALMTGLRLPPEKIAGAVSISGIADLGSSTGRYAVLFGHEPDETEIRAASPSTYLTPDSPPILCTHEHNDNVVPIRASQDFLDAVRRNGTVGESFFTTSPKPDIRTGSGSPARLRTGCIRKSKQPLRHLSPSVLTKTSKGRRNENRTQETADRQCRNHLRRTGHLLETVPRTAGQNE